LARFGRGLIDRVDSDEDVGRDGIAHTRVVTVRLPI
jgi:hypothetical protein